MKMDIKILCSSLALIAYSEIAIAGGADDYFIDNSDSELNKSYIDDSSSDSDTDDEDVNKRAGLTSADRLALMSPNDDSNDNYNPYHSKKTPPIFIESIIKGKLEIIEYLIIKKGVNVNQKVSKKAESALWYAVSKGYSDIVELLVKNGANVDYCSFNHKSSVLALAASSVPAFGEEALYIVNFLLENHANPNLCVQGFFENMPLFQAIYCNKNQIIKETMPANMIKNSEDENDSDLDLQLKMVKLLLDNGANPNITDKDGRTPLMLAIDIGCTDVAKLLLTLPKSGNSEVIELMNKSKEKYENVGSGKKVINENTNSSLKSRDSEVIELANKDKKKYELFIDIDAQDKFKNTALMHVVDSRQISNERRVELIESLLEKGADPNIRDIIGLTALDHAKKRKIEGTAIKKLEKVTRSAPNILEKIKRHEGEAYKNDEGVYVMNEKELEVWIGAAVNNDIEFIQNYISKGVDVDQAVEGKTRPALWYAVARGNTKIVKQLRRNGANINYCDFESGRSVLMEAVRNWFVTKNSDIVRYLLKHDANLDHKDKTKKTVHDYAKEYGLSEPFNRIIDETKPHNTTQNKTKKLEKKLSTADRVPAKVEKNKGIEKLEKIIRSASNTSKKIKRHEGEAYYKNDGGVYVMDERELEIWIGAATDNDIEFIQNYISKGVDVDQAVEGKTRPALWYAVARGNTKIVKQLRRNGANINYCDFESGRSVLMEAVRNWFVTKNSDIVRYLLKHDANLDHKDKTKKTVHDYAEEYGLSEPFNRIIDETKQSQTGKTRKKAINL